VTRLERIDKTRTEQNRTEQKRKEKKRKEKKRKEKKRKDRTFGHQFNEKPSITPGCRPRTSLMLLLIVSASDVQT